MAKFTRGFTGRRTTRDPRLPPGQYDAGPGLAGADRRGHAQARHRVVDVHASRGSSNGPPPGRGSEIHALPRIDLRRVTSTA